MRLQTTVGVLLSILVIGCKQSSLEILQQAETFAQQGKYNKAIELCNKVLAKDSTVQLAYFNRGIYYSNTKEYSKAILDFNKIISLQPQTTGISYQVNRGSQFASEEDKLKITPEEALYQRAATEYIIGNFQSSLRDFNICIANGYQPPPKCYVWLGNIYIKNGEKEKGCDMYSKATILGDSEADELRKVNCK